jgi:hypothetical protein
MGNSPWRIRLGAGLVAALFLTVGGLAGCEREPEDQIKDGLEDIGEGISDAVEDAGDKIEDATD